MSKCQVCRDKEVELLTRWERIRNWLFKRTNYVFFPEDWEDMRSEKFTQGYSDGTRDGADYERRRYETLHDKYNL